MGWRILSLIALFLGSVSLTQASPISPQVGMLPSKTLGWWEGKASFSGQIVIPACALVMENSWQVVDIGVFSFQQLQYIEKGPEKYFQLRLQDCDLVGSGNNSFTGNRIRVSFDGTEGETSGKFAMMGQATGLDLQIIDEQGMAAIAGQRMPPSVLKGNEQRLNYALRVVHNGEPLKAGKYFAALRFKVEYE